MQFTKTEYIGEVELHLTQNGKGEYALIVGFPYYWPEEVRDKYCQQKITSLWPNITIVSATAFMSKRYKGKTHIGEQSAPTKSIAEAVEELKRKTTASTY